MQVLYCTCISCVHFWQAASPSALLAPAKKDTAPNNPTSNFILLTPRLRHRMIPFVIGTRAFCSARALDQCNARTILNAVENDFSSVRRHVEIANDEA